MDRKFNIRDLSHALALLCMDYDDQSCWLRNWTSYFSNLKISKNFTFTDSHDYHPPDPSRGALIQYNEINPLLHLKKGKNQAITKNRVPGFCNLIPLRWSYEALLISQNEYNLLNKNLSKVEESKATLLGKKTLSEIEKTKLSQHKEAYTMLYGLRADTSSQIIRQMKKIISSLEANSFDAQDYLTEGKLSSMNFFQNNKVNDLITQAEIETEDYRNNKKLRMLLIQISSLQKTRTLVESHFIHMTSIFWY